MFLPGHTVVFRPPRLLRLLFAVFGVVCAWAAVWQIAVCVMRREPERLPGALVIALPCLLAAAAIRKRVVAAEDGLRSTTLLGTRFISWEAVRRIDQTRASFVIETEKGPVSAGWLATGARDRLMRLTLEKARLTVSREKLRWGLIARYVPRARTIEFAPFQHTNKN